MYDYQTALQKARDQSLDGCVQHVNAILDKDDNGTPRIAGYKVDDWYDGTTVASFESGWPK